MMRVGMSLRNRIDTSQAPSETLDLMISASRRYQHPMQHTLAIRFDAGTREPADLVVEFRMFTETVQRHGDVRQGRRRRDVDDEPLHIVKHNRSQVSRTPREWDCREARKRRDLEARDQVCWNATELRCSKTASSTNRQEL